MYRRAWVLFLLCLAGCGGPHEGDTGPEGALLTWGGPGRNAGRFLTPRAMAVSEGRIYVVDKTRRLQLFDPDGQWLATWRLGSVNRGFPTGLGFAPDGRLAIADTHNYRVLLYDREGNAVGTIGREGGGPGEFTYLTDVAFDSSGAMYVSEHGRSDRVQKFDRAGGFVAAWGRTGGAPGEFNRPQALAVDREDRVYVADAANHRIQKFSTAGELLKVFGGPGRGRGEMLYPYDLAMGPGGILLVCEYGNNRIQGFDARGRSLGTLGRAGRGPGELAGPWAVVWVTGRGLYIADSGNHRIQLLAMPRTWRVDAAAP